MYKFAALMKKTAEEAAEQGILFSTIDEFA